uniref:Uncharacterized protein n=1 Tax=Meloidogyne javanica TaxID=6303 RepID=A0A915LL38_MELJA
MKNEFDCPVELGQPAVSYKETLKTPYRFNFRHKKQTGGHGQFGEIEGVINPQPPERNTIVEFTDNSVGEGVPKKFMSSLRKGLEAITKEGPLIKAPVTGIEVILQDGKTHIVDTTDIAMIVTMMNMMREAYERANWILLEPVVKVECVVPMEFESQVVKTLIERKGIVTATATGAEYSTLECEAPLREMFGYSTILRTQTQGKGEFTMEFKRYTPVEPYIQDEVIYDWKVANEIYRYTCEDMLFAAAWSNKIYEDRRFRLVVGTLLDEEKIMNNKDPSQPELFATTSNYLRIFRYHPNRDFNQIPITLECELYSTNKSNIYSAPLTGLDWNEVDSTLLATCSIDTTCTVWNVETVQQIGQVKAIEGSQKTQLIAHEKPVHDIAFAKLDSGGRDQFATAGADGSVRLFDLRSLQHSTILYEDPEKRMLNHVAWNKREHTKLATVAHESFEVVILDIRVPCRPLARFGNHRGFINGIAWAPHSTVHICTAGSDRQALIWQMNHFNRDEPILAYTAEGEINQIHWSNNFHQWISICFNKSMEILRV